MEFRRSWFAVMLTDQRLLKFIFPLHDFLLGLSDVSRKGEQEILGHPLLQRDARGRVGLLPPMVGSICRLEIPASFCKPLLNWLAA